MSTRKRVKANKNYKQIWKLSSAAMKRLMNWLLRSLLVMGRRVRLSKSGFVLPTVAMVMLVVMLLTTAILIRSFDRSKNASNVRVNQAVLNAAAPALDRARAKIEEVFKDPTLPRATPSDRALYNALNRNRYTLGDEARLKLAQEFNNVSGIQSNTPVLENDETLTTAWRFPVDTDDNGKFDSYTFYSIYFRSPTRGTDGKFNRPRNPLEARTPPMSEGDLSQRCATAVGTSASLVGESDWYKTGNKLTKSFFVYIASIPITNPPTAPLVGTVANYETYRGNTSFSALELQQDRVRIPLNNNAAWYEDDIEVSNATTVRLNGRVFTSSNLLVAGNTSSNKMMFYQVSDPDSCYYEQENSKIVIGGNIANADTASTTDLGEVEVHRFQGKATAPTGQTTGEGISSTNKTTTENGGRWVGYNNNAYSQRIGMLVPAALALHGTGDPTVATVSAVTRYPQEVKDRFKQRFNDPNETKEPSKILTEELQTYFKDHTRRVPYIEVPGSTGLVTAVGSYTADPSSTNYVLGSTSPIRPPDTWMAIENPTSGSTSGYTNLPLNFGTGTMRLAATEPTTQQKDGKEYFIGDRILVGNNLPYSWPKYTAGTFDKFAEQKEQQPVKNGTNTVYWNNPSTGNATTIPRTRQSQVQSLPDLGSVERDGFWETEAAKQPAANEDTGGLRVITGAGVYIDGVSATTTLGGTGLRKTDPLAVVTPLLAKSFLPGPSLNASVTDPPRFTTATITSGNDNIIVWPDLMPMWDGNLKGDLQMRATAVYHYKQGSASTTDPGKIDPKQVPIACVSSYYDPTDITTARNLSGLPDVSGTYDTDENGTNDSLADGSALSGPNNGHSNNGIIYNTPYTDDTGRISAVTTYRDKLNRQARAIFPTGRIVNDPLRKALFNIDAARNRSLADNAAIDTTICALKILDGTLNVQTSPNVPPGAIKEAAFLDGRQVKSLNNDIKADGTLDNTKIAETKAKLRDSYTLPLEQRQPLEVRVTELDLRLLRTKTIGTPTDSSSGSGNDQEYLLPNSGIIYATRDDALLDLSDDTSTDPNTQALLSPTDFKLDSTRRPNGIRLINGSNLARTNFYRVAEKGLILTTNLPSYVKGKFNLHQEPGGTTVREEFSDTLADDWSDFYTRNSTLNSNFACRQNQPGCAGTGDQWRPATIISDAQIFLSTGFWDGFRNQGDYDLSNNQGNSAASDRLNNGFWNNNFVTSADWVNSSSGYPLNKKSYLTNGVTPIQRRVEFPEYLMEVCGTLPVTACGPNDWYVKLPTVPSNPSTGLKASDVISQPFNINTHKSGTTALPAASDYQRYPRRLAVLRRTDGSNRLILTKDTASSSAKDSPIPIGINPSGVIALYPYTGSYIKGSTTYNAYSNSNKPQIRTGKPALWYRTSSDANDPTPRSDSSTDRYSIDFPLQYMADSDLILPKTVCLNKNSSNAGNLVLCPTSWNSTIANLNLPTSDKASGYAVCVLASNKGATKRYKTTSTDFNGTCPGSNNNTSTVSGVIKGTRDILAALTSPVPTGILTAAGGTITASAEVNVSTLPSGGFNNGAVITLQKSITNLDPVFVLKAPNGSFDFGANNCGSKPSVGCNGVKVILDDVDPNNVFWILDGGSVKFQDVNTSAQVASNSSIYWGHEIKGNVFGGSSMHMGNNVEIEGRLLGNSNAVQFSSPSNSNVTAIVSSNEPPFIPILQIHSPTGTPGSSPFAGSLQNNWVQVATTTTANAAFVTGDSPSRPDVNERGGGLPNFVRFLENWNNQTARISGSFIQYKKSSYASAPFYPVGASITDPSASLFYTLNGSNQAPYRLLNTDIGFRYRGGVFDERASYYYPPTRAYGFDVALLSQSPDLFAQKLTLNPTNPPNEYFRELGRDDPWIQALLCAAEASDRRGGSGATYTTPAIPDRPPTCPINLPYPANP